MPSFAWRTPTTRTPLGSCIGTLVELRNRPADRHVETERRGKFSPCLHGVRRAPGAERCKLAHCRVEDNVAVHHRRDAHRVESRRARTELRHVIVRTRRIRGGESPASVREVVGPDRLGERLVLPRERAGGEDRPRSSITTALMRVEPSSMPIYAFPIFR